MLFSGARETTQMIKHMPSLDEFLNLNLGNAYTLIPVLITVTPIKMVIHLPIPFLLVFKNF